MHKDTSAGKEAKEERRERRRRRRRKNQGLDGAESAVDADEEDNGGPDADAGADEIDTTDDELDEEQEGSDDDESIEGPPLIYVLNLVNTKQDNTVKRYDHHPVISDVINFLLLLQRCGCKSNGNMYEAFFPTHLEGTTVDVLQYDDMSAAFVQRGRLVALRETGQRAVIRRHKHCTFVAHLSKAGRKLRVVCVL